jgi:acetoacetyl-CoA reductase
MDQVALVTGGTRGIGAAISQGLKAAGYEVCASYAGNDEAANSFAQKTGIKIAKWDVSDFDACQAGVAEVESSLGPVNVLVNNAGITRDTMFHRMSYEQWDQVIRTDLDSVFNMTRAVIESMRELGYGRIINISSINGQKGQAGQVNYSAAKAGMIGFAKALALETAPKGITVNTIAPGYTETDMVAAVPEAVMEKIVSQIPVRRLAQVDEIAKCVVFLSSKDAGFITGATLSANGGQYMA